MQPFKGDNYCDAINNRAFCNYDGGDCCQSTVKTKKVSVTLVLQNKPHASFKEMMFDSVLVTLINTEGLFSNCGVTRSVERNSTSHMMSGIPSPLLKPTMTLLSRCHAFVGGYVFPLSSFDISMINSLDTALVHWNPRLNILSNTAVFHLLERL